MQKHLRDQKISVLSLQKISIKYKKIKKPDIFGSKFYPLYKARSY